jgi:hypothetical protein
MEFGLFGSPSILRARNPFDTDLAHAVAADCLGGGRCQIDLAARSELAARSFIRDRTDDGFSVGNIARRALRRRQQIDLGIGHDQAIGQKLREITHNPLAGLRVLIAEALEIADRYFDGARGRVRQHVGRAVRLQ